MVFQSKIREKGHEVRNGVLESRSEGGPGDGVRPQGGGAVTARILMAGAVSLLAASAFPAAAPLDEHPQLNWICSGSVRRAAVRRAAFPAVFLRPFPAHPLLLASNCIKGQVMQ